MKMNIVNNKITQKGVDKGIVIDNYPSKIIISENVVEGAIEGIKTYPYPG